MVFAADDELTTADENEPAQRKNVVMYSSEWCGVCKKAKTYFNANDIPFREYDVEKIKMVSVLLKN